MRSTPAPCGRRLATATLLDKGIRTSMGAPLRLIFFLATLAGRRARRATLEKPDTKADSLPLSGLSGFTALRNPRGIAARLRALWRHLIAGGGHDHDERSEERGRRGFAGGL